MQMIFRNATVWKQNRFMKQDAIFENGMLHFSDSHTIPVSADTMPVFSNCLIFPGFCDVHVHFREPGFCYKETVASGTQAAARGGYTAVCTMPNLNPVPDSREHLQVQLDAIKRDALIATYPYGSLTVGERGEEPSELDGMSEDVIAFSDDGRGVQSEDMMRTLMQRAKALGKMVVAHCEDNSLLRGGYIHNGVYAKEHGHKGICSESEWGQIKRDLRLAEEIGCAYHVCHISTKESVALIREAKARGVNVTCETAPHYLVMSDRDLCEEGRFKMNPPLRDESDRQALIEGILDGTIDMIATDHAPHSVEEKSRGLENSAFGIVGLETAFPILYTELCKTGILSMERLVELMSINPRRRFGITSDAGWTVWDVEREYLIDPNEFASMGRSTPFTGRRVCGTNLLTVYNGQAVYRNEIEN
ncbi:MAG: dihydroorotase [Clostridia bacterium]|nr:dihydroorotase [Clostridia bacterium]